MNTLFVPDLIGYPHPTIIFHGHIRSTFKTLAMAEN